MFGNKISQAYSPTEPLKPGDPLSRQSVAFDLSETRTDLPSTYQDLVQRYQVKTPKPFCSLVKFKSLGKEFIIFFIYFVLQEFKNAMREDTVDFTIYSSNVKRKRPTPRKTSRSAKKPVAYNEDDDDDDDDDRGWHGGGRGAARRLNYSTRSSNRR